MICSVMFFLEACSEGRLEQVLTLAGENRRELEKVIAHYSHDPNDSLKLKSAIFLIENMEHHFTLESQWIEEYYKNVDSVKNLKLGPIASRNRIREAFDSIPSYNTYEVQQKDDLQSLNANYLIKNIDLAVDDWQKGLWAKHLKFEEFCEYILPYRFGTEGIEDWREKLIKKYKHKIDWLDGYDQKRNSAYWAALYLNREIDKTGHYMPPVPFDHTVSYLDNMKIGDCADYAIYAMYIMRACGVPVSVDYTPQWPNRSKRHIWNVVHNNNGKDVVFLGGDIDPGFPHYPSDKFAKVFRHTFAYQKESLFAIKENEEIPASFDTPFIKDVSNHYFEGIDIEIEISPFVKTQKKIAYLAVFDNQKWVPVHWGEIRKDRKASFSDKQRR